MEWASDLLKSLLKCDVASGPRQVAILLGAAASTLTIMATGYALYRRIRGPDGPRRQASDALRDEGQLHAQRQRRERALKLYDLSIDLNPRAAHVRYLRGLLREEMGELKSAIRDWEACRDLLPGHRGAMEKLSHYGSKASPNALRWRVVFGAVVLVALVAIIGLRVANQPPGFLSGPHIELQKASW